jgi:hypothetical protein
MRQITESLVRDERTRALLEQLYVYLLRAAQRGSFRPRDAAERRRARAGSRVHGRRHAHALARTGHHGILGGRGLLGHRRALTARCYTRVMRDDDAETRRKRRRTS